MATRADARAVRRPPRAGHDRRRRPGPAAGPAAPARGAGGRRCWARRSRRARCAEILESLGLRASPDEAGDGARRARVPHWRRGDVTREVDLIEEVARIDGLDACPQTLPSRPDGGRPPHADAAAAAPGRGRAGRRAACSRSLGWSFQAPDVRRPPAPAGRRPPPARPCTLRNPLSEDQSELRTLLLLVAARRRGLQRRPRRRRPGAVRDRVRVRRRRRRGDAGLPDERRHVGALLTGAARRRDLALGARRRRPTSSPPRACSRPCWTRCGWTGASRPATEPFLHPGPRGGGPRRAASRSAGWARLHPLVARGLGPRRRRPAFELDLDRGRRAGRRRSSSVYEDVTSLPGRAPGPGGRACPTTCRAARVARRGPRGAAASCWPRREVFDVYRGEQVGEGKVSLALALEFRAPDRTLTDEEVDERRDGDRRRARVRAGRRAPWLSVAVIGAGAATAARWPRTCCGAIRSSSCGTSPRAATPARRLDELYPRYRVPLELEELDLERHGAVDAAIVAYPARRVGADRRRAARARA